MSAKRQGDGSGLDERQAARKKRMTNDLGWGEEQVRKLESLRGRMVLKREEKIDVLLAYFGLVQEALKTQQATGRKVPTKAVERTARLLGRSNNTVGDLVKTWTDAARYEDDEGLADSVDSVSNRGNKNAKAARVPHSRHVFIKVRDFVQENEAKRERATSAEVIRLLAEQGILAIKVHPSGIVAAKDMLAAQKSVQRYLLRAGFCSGKKTGRIALLPKHVAVRNHFVRQIARNRALPTAQRLREVFVDELFVDEQFKSGVSAADDSLSHAAPAKKSGKARRCVVIAAIQGPSAKSEDGAGLVRGSVWSSEAGQPARAITGESFGAWWKEYLLPNLAEPSLIILDNAPYHKTRPPGTPVVGEMDKPQVLGKLREAGVGFDQDISRVEACELLQNWVESAIKFEVVLLAEQAGHRVLFTPPHYPDLQACEAVLAHVKRNVGLKHAPATTLHDVATRLDKEVQDLAEPSGAALIGSMIGAIDSTLARVQAEIKVEDEGPGHGRAAGEDEDEFEEGEGANLVGDVQDVLESFGESS